MQSVVYYTFNLENLGEHLNTYIYLTNFYLNFLFLVLMISIPIGLIIWVFLSEKAPNPGDKKPNPDDKKPKPDKKPDEMD
jgi:hypothetical protein